jgi:nucleoside-diphosphate-sugar epimerase
LGRYPGRQLPELQALEARSSKFLNVGIGKDITIAEFAQLVADVVAYRGRFVFDTSRPDGAPQTLLDTSELTRLGWRAKIRLRDIIAGRMQISW